MLTILNWFPIQMQDYYNIAVNLEIATILIVKLVPQTQQFVKNAFQVSQNNYYYNEKIIYNIGYRLVNGECIKGNECINTLTFG